MQRILSSSLLVCFSSESDSESENPLSTKLRKKFGIKRKVKNKYKRALNDITPKKFSGLAKWKKGNINNKIEKHNPRSIR